MELGGDHQRKSGSDSDLRLANLADVLAEAVREGRIAAPDARRVIVHELRRLNTNNKLAIRPRSVAAQASIDTYARAGELPPKNGSPHALHADHYGMLAKEDIASIVSLDAWLEVVMRVRRSIVCVTAAENYALEKWEREGHLGAEKYALAGIEFVDPLPWAQPTA